MCSRAYMLATLTLMALLLNSSGCALFQGRETTNLPELRLDRLDGGSWELRGEAGRVVVLQFFATFDNSSLTLVTELEQLHIQYGSRGVTIVGVAMDPGEDRIRGRVVEAFCALANLTFDIVLASDSVGRGETELGEIPTIPATVIFNRAGEPVASVAGRFRDEELEELLEGLVSE
jgi:hypothetical protein